MYCSKCGSKLKDNKCIECDNITLKESNTAAILGFIFGFFGYFSILGLVLSIIALVTAKNYKKDRTGLAIAGVIISSIIFIIGMCIKVYKVQNGADPFNIYDY